MKDITYYIKIEARNDVGSDIKEQSVITEDNTAPEATITLSSTNAVEGENITATVEQTDNESGINVTGSKWIYNTTAEEIGTNAADYTGGTFSTNPETITLSNSSLGIYYLHILTVDNAGNAKETISSAVAVTPEWSDPYTSTVKDNYTDSAGKKATIPEGFQVSLRVESNKIDEGLVVRGPDKSEFVWIPVPDVTEMYEVQNGNKVGKLYTFSGTSSTQITYSTTGNREPVIVNDTVANITSLGINGVTTQQGFKDYLQTEFDNMIDSISRYNGFYIGRYETGDLSKTTVVSQKNNKDLGSKTWYVMYKKQKEMYASNNSVVSGMIWGSQWDRVMRWFQGFGGDTATYVTNSAGKGNYSGVQIATGSNNAYIVKNMYDMAGNINEWTLEGGSTATVDVGFHRIRRRWSIS